MEAPKAPDKCFNCTRLVSWDNPILCGMCKDAIYCNKECETADFESHRASCKAKERIMAVQQQCTDCMKLMRKTEEHCEKCGGVKYCSNQCKEADKDRHELVCGAYANLAPRPTKAHRVCILFPADEETPRLVWVPMASDGLAESAAVQDIVAPDTKSIEYNAALNIAPDDDVDEYRDITLCHTQDFAFVPNLANNRSLGLATAGHPVESVKGHLLVLASHYTTNQDDELVGTMSDATPADLSSVLKCLTRLERLRGLDPAQRMALMSREAQSQDSDEDSDDGEAGQSSSGEKQTEYEDWETSDDERDY